MLDNFDRKIELSDGLETQYVKVLYYEFDKALTDTYKSYEYSRLCTIIEGEKTVSVNGEKAFSYDKNKFLLLPPQANVEMDISQATKALVLELSDDMLESTSQKISSQFELPSSFDKDDLFVGNNQGPIDYCMNRISTALRNTKEDDMKFLMDIYVQELVYFLLKEKGAANILHKTLDHPVSIAISIMKANLSPALSIEEIASQINHSLPSFSRKFKSVVGLSPKTYYTHLKLIKSTELLHHKTVNETAWELGFDNVGHFIRLFKTRYLQTPKDYQIGLLNE